MDKQKFTKAQVLEILDSMVDNLQFLSDTIRADGDPSFDFDVASVYADYKFYPMMEYLATTDGRPFSG